VCVGVCLKKKKNCNRGSVLSETSECTNDFKISYKLFWYNTSIF